MSVALEEVAPLSSVEFEDFYRAQSASVYRALSLALGDTDFGREATDEAMARAYQHWRNLSGYDNPAAWTYRVGLNWARSQLRKGHRELSTASPEPASLGGSVFDGSIDRSLQDALARLPVEARSVVVLRYLLDWSTADVAEALGVPEGTVKSRLTRALHRLQALLEES